MLQCVLHCVLHCVLQCVLQHLRRRRNGRVDQRQSGFADMTCQKSALYRYALLHSEASWLFNVSSTVFSCIQSAPTATHCNTLRPQQCIATHCAHSNALQHTARRLIESCLHTTDRVLSSHNPNTNTHQCPATPQHTLQHPATNLPACCVQSGPIAKIQRRYSLRMPTV